MTVGVVAGNTAAEPENVVDGEIIAQALLDIVARKIGIPILIQEAGLSRKLCAAAVHVYRAAFEDHVRIKNRQFQDFSEACRHDFIEIKRRVFVSPCVVTPVHYDKSRIANA